MIEFLQTHHVVILLAICYVLNGIWIIRTNDRLDRLELIVKLYVESRNK